MNFARKGWIAAGLLAASSITAFGAGNYETYPQVGQPTFCASSNPNGTGVGGITGQQGSPANCVQTVPAGPLALTGSELVPADTNAAGPTQTVTIPSALLGNFSGTPRNYLDNGALNVQQRGTGTVTCAAAAAITSAAYGPDRFGCSANVTSGAGRQALVTTAALLPAGFASVDTLFRTSGALTQPVCVHQEVPTSRATALAGKTVTLSYYAAALAGLAADNNSIITASIYYGTGSDQGYGTMTASPAITPAWTGIAFVSGVNQAAQVITTTPTRYSATGAVPSTATEVGIALCFTPTATGAGATDGFAFTGVQLEVAPSPTAYEFQAPQVELATAQRYFYRITESATVIGQRALCAISTTSLAVCQIRFPVPMRVAPTMTYTAGFALTGSAQTGANVCAAVRTSTTLTSASATTEIVPIDCTSSAAFGAAGTIAQLYDLGTGSSTGIITASADF